MSSDPKERRAKLQTTWLLMANAVLRSLQDEKPSASTLDVARRWLDSNGVTLETLQSWRGELGFDPSSLPRFDDADEHSDSGDAPGDDALKRVPPFAAE